MGGKQTKGRKEGGEDSRGRRRERKQKGRGMDEGGRVIKSEMYPQHSTSILLFSLFSSLSAR